MKLVVCALPPLCFMSEDGGFRANAGPGRAREKVVYRWRLLEEMLKKEIVMDDFRRGLGHYLFIQKERKNPINMLLYPTAFVLSDNVAILGPSSMGKFCCCRVLPRKSSFNHRLYRRWQKSTLKID